jgi:pimeloyl-ACP methyl ester carboxylesterase
LVAVALALKLPDMVRGLVLASGYYYPSVRPDVASPSSTMAATCGASSGSTFRPPSLSTVSRRSRQGIWNGDLNLVGYRKPAPIMKFGESRYLLIFDSRDTLIAHSNYEALPPAFHARKNYINTQ